MKKLLIAAFISSTLFAYAQHTLPAASPRQTVEQQFSTSKISVDYGRPGVKGRKVFGELVPYNKLWRAGANGATKITFAQPVSFGGKTVPAGTYGLFVIPTDKEWKVILNKDAQQWGAYAYDEKLNVTDITVPVQKLSEKQEWFAVELNPLDENSLDMVIKWDLAKITVPIKVANSEVMTKVVEKLKEIRQIERDAAAKK
ncbi:DUF2911 domain-containing protein [Chryseobacterium sp. HSC-36S06]|uniref:DUF2911 domain-containing protein n=1 Tax=Chryseobacterium sp. HSC-36S06 TaxID=2910970 RepID=UPI00209E00D3|nr:DUF2911 domain-containing protein [Chryseobacterium sp. HSC-36S06]MCP2038300.1 hypothetical protein [Chryseobacterium sp. HSC-36S06]